LSFEYSDLSANYPTHCMLIPTKNFAVETSTAPFKLDLPSFKNLVSLV
jgi:hypothetical protein